MIYRKQLKTFSQLTRDAFELSIYLLSVFDDSTKDVSSKDFVFLSVFSKIALHANSILTILPKDVPAELYGTESFKIIDLSADGEGDRLAEGGYWRLGLKLLCETK